MRASGMVPQDGNPPCRISLKRTLILSMLMVLTSVCLAEMSQVKRIPPKRPLEDFPRRVGEWMGVEERLDEKVYAELGVDDSFLGNYRNADGRQIQLYVGFYQSQREGDLIHSPRHCLPGAGWNILHTSVEALTVPSLEKRIDVLKLVIEKDNLRQVVLYWFQSRGRFVASEYKEKLYLVVDSIMRNRTDGCFVQVMTPIVDDQSETIGKIGAFAAEVISILQQYLPP